MDDDKDIKPLTEGLALLALGAKVFCKDCEFYNNSVCTHDNDEVEPNMYPCENFKLKKR